LRLDLDQIDEQALRSLEANQIPESLRLEYKRELALRTRDEKREACKDISALANTTGGTILYGIEEKASPDGPVAGPISPLSDGQIESVLADVIVSGIHPRPRFASRKIPIAGGGFVLAVEVYDSFGRDLHIVSGYGESRFYRRHPQGVFPMTEPEIREAYLRIAASRADLEASIQRQVDTEIALREKARESIIIVPWFSGLNLIHPRQLKEFRRWLEEGPVYRDLGEVFGSHFEIFTSGFRALTDPPRSPAESTYYFGVLKNGLIHLSSLWLPGDDQQHLHLLGLLSRFVSLLAAARELYDRAGYWGPVRVFHVLRFPSAYQLSTYGALVPGTRAFGEMPAGTYSHTFYEVNLLQERVGSIAKELLDQVFHSIGQVECPWFTPEGEVTPALRGLLQKEPTCAAARVLLGS